VIQACSFGVIISTPIAALYVDPRGPYPKLEGVDCWDASRDARLYEGPHAIVAHPPCAHWGKLRHLARTNDADCAPIAIIQVRQFGGVLEHPAGSKLWDRYPAPHVNLPKPGEPPDAFGGYSIEVDQCSWGHCARKTTWLYLVGVPREALESPPFPDREPTHWVSGFRARGAQAGASGYKKNGCAVPPGIKVCSAEQRRRTPPLFAEYLVRLARSVVRR
jgi:hypothetical protein